LAGSCRGAYLAIFAGFWGLTWKTGTVRTTGITGVEGIEVITVWGEGTFVGEEGIGGEFWDVDGELGELGVERNRILTGVGIELGSSGCGLLSAKRSWVCWFLTNLGMVLGFSKIVGGLGSG